MTCHDAEPLIARYADDESSLDDGARERLRAHVAACAACRAAVAEQRETAAVLRARLATAPRPGFAARVSARIDREEDAGAGSERQGADAWFGPVNWRAWTVGLAPVAAALIVAAYVDIGSARSATVSQTVRAMFDEWMAGGAPAALQASPSGDALIETVLTGSAPSSGETNGR